MTPEEKLAVLMRAAEGGAFDDLVLVTFLHDEILWEPDALDAIAVRAEKLLGEPVSTETLIKAASWGAFSGLFQAIVNRRRTT
jgi:hypothetical protein